MRPELRAGSAKVRGVPNTGPVGRVGGRLPPHRAAGVEGIRDATVDRVRRVRVDKALELAGFYCDHRRRHPADRGVADLADLGEALGAVERGLGGASAAERKRGGGGDGA